MIIIGITQKQCAHLVNVILIINKHDSFNSTYVTRKISDLYEGSMWGVKHERYSSNSSNVFFVTMQAEM